MAAELVDHIHPERRGGKPFVGVNSFTKERPPTLNTANFPSAQSGTAFNDPGSSSSLDAPARTSAPAASTSTPALTTASSRETPSYNNADTTEPLNRGLRLPGPENHSDEPYHQSAKLCAKCYTEITPDVHDGVAHISYALSRYIAATSPYERSYHFRGVFAEVGEQSGSIRGPCYIYPGTTSVRAEKTNSMPSSVCSRTSLMSVCGDMAGLIAGSGEWVEMDVWERPATIDDAAMVGEDEEVVYRG
jgi:hypothetical protein